jgi:hypothetical protein
MSDCFAAVTGEMEKGTRDEGAGTRKKCLSEEIKEDSRCEPSTCSEPVEGSRGVAIFAQDLFHRLLHRLASRDDQKALARVAEAMETMKKSPADRRGFFCGR